MSGVEPRVQQSQRDQRLDARRSVLPRGTRPLLQQPHYHRNRKLCLLTGTRGIIARRKPAAVLPGRRVRSWRERGASPRGSSAVAGREPAALRPGDVLGSARGARRVDPLRIQVRLGPRVR